MTQPPTIAQLHNLTDRAAHGLTADEQQRLRDGLARLAEYENTINWHTTCTGCARVLDSCIRETERAERAETALARIQALADDHPAGIDTALIRAALPDRPTDGTPPVHVGGRANAEDCPACRGTNPPYPWICPVEKQPGPAAHNDGPTVREAAADDRHWPLQKTGE